MTDKNTAALTTANVQTQVYLIRHGIAAERGLYADDRQRPLTEKGTYKTKQIAQQLVALGLQFDVLLTSPLVRAVQTAEIFHQIGLAGAPQLCQALAPAGELQDWLMWLRTWQSSERQTLALVGHEPDLSQWAQRLVQGELQGRWVLKKAGIIGLTVPAAEHALGQSQLFWLSPPRFIV